MRIARIGRGTVTAKVAVLMALCRCLRWLRQRPIVQERPCSGLRRPMGMALSNQGNLLYPRPARNTAQRSHLILDPSGNRRTLWTGSRPGERRR